MRLKYDIFYGNKGRKGQEICGTLVDIHPCEPGGVTALLACGEGNEAEAGIIASFMMRMAASLLKSGQSAENVVASASEMIPQPANSGDQIPALTVLQASGSGSAVLAQMNMPPPLMLRRGKLCDIPLDGGMRQGKNLCKGSFTIKKGSLLVLFNQGFLNAGVPNGTGWTLEEIAGYVRAAYHPGITAKKLTELLLTAADSLSGGTPKEDMSVLTLRALVCED